MNVFFTLGSIFRLLALFGVISAIGFVCKVATIAIVLRLESPKKSAIPHAKNVYAISRASGDGVLKSLNFAAVFATDKAIRESLANGDETLSEYFVDWYHEKRRPEIRRQMKKLHDAR